MADGPIVDAKTKAKNFCSLGELLLNPFPGETIKCFQQLMRENHERVVVDIALEEARKRAVNDKDKNSPQIDPKQSSSK